MTNKIVNYKGGNLPSTALVERIDDPIGEVYYKKDPDTGQLLRHLQPRSFKLGKNIKETIQNAYVAFVDTVVNQSLELQNWGKQLYYNPKKAVRTTVNFIKNNKETLELASALAPLPVKYAYNRAKAKVQTWLTDKPLGNYANAVIDYATGTYTPNQEINYYYRYPGKATRQRAVVAAAFNKIKKEFNKSIKDEKKQEVEKRRADYREMKEKALNARLQRGVNRYMYGRYKYDNKQNRYSEGGGYPSRYESTVGKKYKSNRYHTQRKRIPRRIYFQLRKEGKIRWYHGNMIILPNRYGY